MMRDDVVVIGGGTCGIGSGGQAAERGSRCMRCDPSKGPRHTTWFVNRRTRAHSRRCPRRIPPYGFPGAIREHLTHDENHFILIRMSKRLQVLLDEKEMRDIQRTAKRQQMTVAEWVRQALRAAHRQVPLTDTKKKLGVVRTATRYDFPTGDVDQILREIDQGYQVKRPS